MNTDVNKAFKSSVGMNNLGFYTREKIVITVSKAKDGVRERGGVVIVIYWITSSNI